VKNRPESEIAEYRKKKGISIFGKIVPNPVLTFLEAQFPRYILNVLTSLNFSAPTSIQSQGI
jgi:ATP-dependent RNA helicase DDX5/DBP2